MKPTLHDGDWVIYCPCGSPRELTGRVVVCRHPYESRLLIKRVSRVTPKNELFLLGDLPEESTDSRMFGAVASSKLKGCVVSYRRGAK